MKRIILVMFYLVLFPLVGGLLCLSFDAMGSKRESVSDCFHEAKKTARTDKKEVCFTRKEAYCILLARANHKAIKRQYERAFSILKSRFDAQIRRLLFSHQSEIEAKEAQIRIMAKERCPSQAIPWTVGTSSGFVAGAIAAGVTCYALCANKK